MIANSSGTPSVPASVDTPVDALVSDMTAAVDSQNTDSSSTLLSRRPGDLSALAAADASQNDVTLQEASVTRAKSRDVMDFEHLKMKLDQLTGTAPKKDGSGVASVPQVAAATVKAKADVDLDPKETASDGTSTASSSVASSANGTASSSVNRSATAQQTPKSVIEETSQHGVLNTQLSESATDAVSPSIQPISVVTTQTSASSVPVPKASAPAATHRAMPSSQNQATAAVPIAQNLANAATIFEQGLAGAGKPVISSGSSGLLTTPLPVGQPVPPVVCTVQGLAASSQPLSSLTVGLSQQRVASPALVPGHHPATALTGTGTVTGGVEHLGAQTQQVQQQLQYSLPAQVGYVIPTVVPATATPSLISNSGSTATTVYADGTTLSAPNSPKSNHPTTLHVPNPGDLTAITALYQQLSYQWMMQQALLANAAYLGGPNNPTWPMFGNLGAVLSNSNPLLAAQLPFPTQMFLLVLLRKALLFL